MWHGFRPIGQISSGWRIYYRSLSDYLGTVQCTEAAMRAALGRWLIVDGNRVIVTKWRA